MINSQKVLHGGGNFESSDEAFTPDYGVEPILKYIPKYAIVWCPFDKENSEFVKQISKTNKVIYSHIDDAKDFFEYEPDSWDIIISNPPFQGKRQFFKRALSFKKPFALIMTNAWLNDAAPVQLFKNRNLQLLMFDKRMKFENPDGRPNNKITFCSSYYCCDFLPKDVILQELAKFSYGGVGVDKNNKEYKFKVSAFNERDALESIRIRYLKKKIPVVLERISFLKQEKA